MIPPCHNLVYLLNCLKLVFTKGLKLSVKIALDKHFIGAPKIKINFWQTAKLYSLLLLVNLSLLTFILIFCIISLLLFFISLSIVIDLPTISIVISFPLLLAIALKSEKEQQL